MVNMDKKPDREMQEMMEELAEDLGRNRENDENLAGSGISSGFMLQDRTLFIGVVSVLILIVFFIVFFGIRNKASQKDLNAINVKLEQIEKRLTSLHSAVEKTAHLENQIKGLQKSVSTLERSRNAIKGEQDKLARSIEQLQKTRIPAAGKTKPPQTVQKRSDSQTKKLYHQVRKGETLFQIAKKYGTSLNELRRLNNITGSKVYPGQKILIPSKGQQ
jgi:LysM repeat protein